MQSLTLVLWGACRTLDGPGFEPLISKASKLTSFDDKESSEGIFCNGSLKRRGVAGRAWGFPLVVGDVALYARAVRARLFRRLPRVGGEAWAAAGGWDDATVPPRPAGYCTVITAERVCGSICNRGTLLSAASKSTPFNAAV